jgi:hypothetical protein
MAGDEYVTEWPAENEARQEDYCTGVMTLEPAGMERLGQIPHDIELSVGAGVPNGSGR